MPRLNSRAFFLLMALQMTVAALPLQAEPTEQTATDQLAQILGSFASLTADYRQLAADGSSEVQTGKLWLEKPNRFRIESAPPLSQVVVSDGTDLWTHDIDLEQVIIAPLDAEAGDLPALLFAGEGSNLATRFLIEGYPGEADHIFLLTPLADSAIEQLALVFDGTESQTVPKSITLETATRQITRIEFSAVELDPRLPADRFHFTPPPGVDVIDDRPAR